MTAVAAGPASVLVGYDGSLAANAAIDVAARLLPGATAQVLHLWEPPFTAAGLRHRLVREAATVEELVGSLEREGAEEAERIAALGVAVARASGWTAEPLVQRSVGGDGYAFARLATEHGSSVVVVGSRGLAGTAALLGSVSEVVVHVSPVPVLVVPHPLSTPDRAAAGDGPVVVGIDGSTGSTRALAVAGRLFPGRTLLPATVGTPERAPAADVAVLARRGLGAGGVAAALADYAAEHGAGAVVAGSQGHSAVREVLLGSVVRDLLHQAHRPVLVVPQDRRFTS